jgi:hypothetical protein
MVPKAYQRIHWATVENAEDVNEDGILIDIDVQSIADSGPTREDKTRDICKFFGDMFEYAGANGAVKKHCRCRVCS